MKITYDTTVLMYSVISCLKRLHDQKFQNKLSTLNSQLNLDNSIKNIRYCMKQTE